MRLCLIVFTLCLLLPAYALDNYPGKSYELEIKPGIKTTIYTEINLANEVGDQEIYSIDEEKKALLATLKDAYDYLPDHLKEIQSKVVNVIKHIEDKNSLMVGIPKKFFGYSAEDDPTWNYKEMDQKFFDPNILHNHENQGSIRVNYTQKFIQFIHFLTNVACDKNSGNERACVGGRSLARGIVGHELLHAYQWHTKPALSFAHLQQVHEVKTAFRQEINLPQSQLIRSTKQKIEHERQAVIFDRKFAKPYAAELAEFKKFFEEYEKTHPEKFKQGRGNYFLLSSDVGALKEAGFAPPGPFKEKYVQGRIQGKDYEDQLENNFTLGEVLVYESQWELPYLLLQLKGFIGNEDQISISKNLKRWLHYTPNEKKLLACEKRLDIDDFKLHSFIPAIFKYQQSTQSAYLDYVANLEKYLKTDVESILRLSSACP